MLLSQNEVSFEMIFSISGRVLYVAHTRPWVHSPEWCGGGGGLGRTTADNQKVAEVL
jgi:hypothetical protein